jgi:hypothetical protein
MDEEGKDDSDNDEDAGEQGRTLRQQRGWASQRRRGWMWESKRLQE